MSTSASFFSILSPNEFRSKQSSSQYFSSDIAENFKFPEQQAGLCNKASSAMF